MSTPPPSSPSAPRLATPADLNELVNLVREFCEVDRHDFDESRVRSALMPLLESDRHGLVWLVGQPAEGYAVVTWGYSLESGGADALLDEIYVRGRGSGHGSELLRHILRDLETRGLKRIFLETERHNEAVRRFYARHGFEEESSIWMSKALQAPNHQP
jgi:GNAT superfamily N-acetyltransferase